MARSRFEIMQDLAEAERQQAAAEELLRETESWDDVDPAAVEAFVDEHKHPFAQD